MYTKKLFALQALLSGLVVTVCTLMLISCESIQVSENTNAPSDDFIIDDVEEFDFTGEDVPAEQDETPPHSGAAFVISVSSESYEVKQYSYFGVLRAQSSESRRQRMMNLLARYDRKDVTRTARLLIRISPNSGRMTGYRLVNSTYVRELDSMIMSDIAHIRFVPQGGRIPSVIYVSYVIRLYQR